MIQILRNWLDRHFSDPQLVILGFLLLVGFLIVYILGDMLTPVFVSLIIAYLLDGLISGMHRFRIPRFIAVAIVYLLFLATLLILLIWLIPMLSRQVVQLVQELPKMVTNGQKELLLLPERYPDFVSETQINQIIDFINSELTDFGQYVLTMSLASVRGLIILLVYLILVPLMVFFFLKDKTKMLAWVTRFLPKERSLSAEVWHEVNLQVGNYVRGKIWEIIIVWGMAFIVFSLLELKYTMLLSFFVGLSVLIPYLGAAFMYLPIMLIAYFQYGLTAKLGYTFIAYSVLQVLDGQILAPLLLSEVTSLHPIAIIVAVLIFGGLWGMWGLFFAIPLATLIHAVIKAWLKQLNKEETPEPIKT